MRKSLIPPYPSDCVTRTTLSRGWMYIIFSASHVPALQLMYDWMGSNPLLPLLERFELTSNSPLPLVLCASYASFPNPRRRNREPSLLGRHSLLHTAHVHAVPTLTYWTRATYLLLLSISYTESSHRHSPGCYLRLSTRTQGNEHQRLIVGREGSNRVSRQVKSTYNDTLVLCGCNAF
jgi:hypothetical protein